MSKSPLVKIGVPSAQAESMKVVRTVRQILEWRDESMARIEAQTREKIREAVAAGADEAEAEVEVEAPGPVAAAATA